MGAAGALLGDLGFLVPVDDPVGAGLDDLFAAYCFDRVDDDQAVGTGVDGAVSGETGGLFAMQAGHGLVGNLYQGILAPLFAADVHPAVAVAGLGD